MEAVKSSKKTFDNSYVQYLPYIGKYFKNNTYLHKPYLLEYVDYDYRSHDWYLKGERLHYTDNCFHIQSNMSISNFDINSNVWESEEITKDEYEKAKKDIKNKFLKFSNLYKYGTNDGFKFPEYDENIKPTPASEILARIKNTKESRNFLTYTVVNSECVRLEKITVKNGEVINNMTYQITLSSKNTSDFGIDYWIQFFDCEEENKHNHSISPSNKSWLLNWKQFAKIKNIIQNPLLYIGD